MSDQENPSIPERARPRFDESRVIGTLDSEMSRLEQAATRSGWTMWAGTAALGALIWLFVSLVGPDESYYWFPWERLIITTAFLSFFQDLWNSLHIRIVPKLDRARSHGGQHRVLLTKEALPFERASHTFQALRSAILLACCWPLYPIVGELIMIPTLLYTYIFIKMCTRLWLNLKNRRTSHRIEPERAFLVGSTLSTAVAIYGFSKICPLWGTYDLIALKGSLLAIGGVYIIEWMATPRLELPVLEQIREIRRQLGFGQITADEAVERCEIALFGHPSAKFIESSLTKISDLYRSISDGIVQISDHMAIFDDNIAKLADGGAPTRELVISTASISEQAYTIGLMLTNDFEEFQSERVRIDKTIQNLRSTTLNDSSLPPCETQMNDLVQQFRKGCELFKNELRRVQGSLRILAEAASKYAIRLPEHTLSRVEFIERTIVRLSPGGNLAIKH